jgi:hypothetical protein
VLLYEERCLDNSRSFRNDLYELDLSTHAIRRLTEFSQVVPEFYFNPAGTKLLWTNGEHSHTYVGSFRPSSPPVRSGVTVAPDARWVNAPVHGDTTPPRPVRATRPMLHAAGLPRSVLSSLTLLEAQLVKLAHRLGSLPQGGSCCRS